MKKIRLTSLILGACSVTATLTPLTSCGNQKAQDRNFLISGYGSARVNFSKKVLANGDWQITFSFKTPSKDTISISSIKIGSNTLLITTEYSYENNILTIFKTSLDKYSGDIEIVVDVLPTGEEAYLIAYEKVYTTYMNNVNKLGYSQSDIDNDNIIGSWYEVTDKSQVIHNYDKLKAIEYRTGSEAAGENSVRFQWDSPDEEWTVASVGKSFNRQYISNKLSTYRKQGFNIEYSVSNDSIDYKIWNESMTKLVQEWTYNKFGYLTYCHYYSYEPAGMVKLDVNFTYKVDPHSI